VLTSAYLNDRISFIFINTQALCQVDLREYSMKSATLDNTDISISAIKL